MDTSIWIAVISAGGIVLAATVQWLSNRSTLKASEAREKAVRDEQAERLRLEYADRNIERARVEEQRIQEIQAALKETWRERRLEAHRDALAALDSARNEIAEYQRAWNLQHFGVQPEPFKSGSLAHVRSTAADVGLFCSSASADAFAVAQSRIQTFHAVASGEDFMKTLTNKDSIPTAEDQAQRAARIAKIGDAIAAYRQEAKMDLGTLD